MTEEETKYREHYCDDNPYNCYYPCTLDGKSWAIEDENSIEIKYCPFCGKYKKDF